MGLNTPNGWNDDLKLIMERLSDEKRDELLEMLRKDKELREYKKEWKSEKLINSNLKYLGEITKEIEIMKESVDKILYQRPIFINSFNNILSELDRTVDEFKDIDEWRSNNKNISSLDVKAELQNTLKNCGLNRSGWINILMRLLSYSRNSFIKDKMKEHWIDVSLLESICSNVEKMLDENNIKVVTPTVLVDKFDKNFHEYNNGDTRIDKYFPDISTRDYKWFIFEIVSLWYEIRDDEGNIIESKKPTVYYR